jgi:hypothetical protein
VAKKKPSQISGQAPKPSKLQSRKPKKPRAVEIADRVVKFVGGIFD